MSDSARPAHWLAALAPVALLVLAALIPVLRLPLLVVLGIGGVLAQRLSPHR